MFFRALSELVKEGVIGRQSFRARFVGPGVALARSWAGKAGCEELLEAIPLVPHQEAMLELKQATCLLFTQKGDGGRRRLPEFLASRKPILVFPPEFEQTMSDWVLRKYGAATIIEPHKDIIKAVLTQWYSSFKAAGRLEFPVNEEVVQSFSAKHVAAALGEVLEEVIDGHRRK